MIYLLTAIGLSPGGRSTVHIYTQTIHRTKKKKQTIHRTTQQFWESEGRAPSWLVLPWHLPYNRGKSTEKPESEFRRILVPSSSRSSSSLGQLDFEDEGTAIPKNFVCEAENKFMLWG